MNKINVKFLTDEALATIKANLDKFTKIVKENPSDSSSFIAEIITRFKKHLQKSSKPCVLGIFYLAFFPKGIKILL